MQHLMCAGLWCLVEGDTSCKTKLDPPLDGTECGADKVTPVSHNRQQAAPLSWVLGTLPFERQSVLFSGVPGLSHSHCRTAHGTHCRHMGAYITPFFLMKMQESFTLVYFLE